MSKKYNPFRREFWRVPPDSILGSWERSDYVGAVKLFIQLPFALFGLFMFFGGILVIIAGVGLVFARVFGF